MLITTTNKRYVNNKEYKKTIHYVLVSDAIVAHDELYPFKIDFDDPTYYECYIANIKKTDDISGSQMMELVL